MGKIIFLIFVIEMLWLGLGPSDGSADWPNDVDGDVFRRLLVNGFDFRKEYDIDFNVDFESWPPSAEAIALLNSKYSSVVIVPPDEDDEGNTFEGYIQFQIRSKVSYEFVVWTQNTVTALTKKYGGRCESWGVWQG